MKNRIIAVVLVSVITLSAFTVRGFAFLKGDLNGNGVLEVADAIEVLRISSGIIPGDWYKKMIADMDSDDVITIKDARSILSQSVDLTDINDYHEQLNPYTDHGFGTSTFCVVNSYYSEVLPASPIDNKSNPLYSAIPYGTFDIVTSDLIHHSESGNDFYVLASGRRLYANEIQVFNGYNMPYNKAVLKKIVTKNSGSTQFYLALDWRVPFNVTVNPQEYVTGFNSRSFNIKDGVFTGNYIDITFNYTTYTEGELSFPESNVISHTQWITDGNNATLRVYLKNTGCFFGYTAYYDSNNYLVISVKEKMNTLSGKVIEIDPGHGGKEPGAGSGTGVYERDVTYNIATYLKAYLESAGATVVFSRDNSASVPEIEERRLNTLKNNPDMFVSVHCDSSDDSSMNGSSVYYYKNYSGPLAFAISRNLPSAVKNDLNYAMFDKGAHFYPFMVTRVENCPAVLVECGFISNSQDFAIINSPAGQNSIARGIYNGIVEYCSWY